VIDVEHLLVIITTFRIFFGNVLRLVKPAGTFS